MIDCSYRNIKAINNWILTYDGIKFFKYKHTILELEVH